MKYPSEMLIFAAALFTAVTGLACSSGSSDNTQDSDTQSDTTGNPDAGVDGGDGNVKDCISSADISEEPLFDRMRQGFEVRLWETEGSLEGGVLQGPPSSFHQTSAPIGDCRLRTYNGASCEEMCMYGTVCIDGECIEMPPYQPIGPVTVRDSTGYETETAPTDIGKYFLVSDEFNSTDNDWVSLNATVDEESVRLTTCVPEPLIETTSFSDLFSAWISPEDVVLRWSNPDPTARIYLLMTTCIGTHAGISPVEIECEGRDSGELVIPGEFIEALNCPGCWGHGECGNHEIIRYHTDEITTTAGLTVRLNNVQGNYFSYYPSSE